MAYFAQIDDANRVLRVVAIADSDCNGGVFPLSEPTGIAFCQQLFGQETRWLQTSYNNQFRGQYAGVGYSYDTFSDVFIAPPNDEEMS